MRRELGALLGDKSDETKAAHVTALADCATRRASLAGVGSAYVQKESYRLETRYSRGG